MASALDQTLEDNAPEGELMDWLQSANNELCSVKLLLLAFCSQYQHSLIRRADANWYFVQVQMKAATSPKRTEEDKTLQQKFREQIKVLESAIDANRRRLKEIKTQVRNKTVPDPRMVLSCTGSQEPAARAIDTTRGQPQQIRTITEPDARNMDQLTDWLHTAHSELLGIQTKANTSPKHTPADKAKQREYGEQISQLNQAIDAKQGQLQQFRNTEVAAALRVRLTKGLAELQAENAACIAGAASQAFSAGLAELQAENAATQAELLIAQKKKQQQRNSMGQLQREFRKRLSRKFRVPTELANEREPSPLDEHEPSSPYSPAAEESSPSHDHITLDIFALPELDGAPTLASVLSGCGLEKHLNVFVANFEHFTGLMEVWRETKDICEKFLMSKVSDEGWPLLKVSRLMRALDAQLQQ